MSLCESSSSGVNSQKKWSTPLGPWNCTWDMTEMMTVDDRNTPSKGAGVLWRHMSKFMCLVENRGWHTAQY